jgi:hypothetical protein
VGRDKWSIIFGRDCAAPGKDRRGKHIERRAIFSG